MGSSIFNSQRPPPDQRSFVSNKIEKVIHEITESMEDKELAWIFENCFPNTLDTTIDFEIIDGKPDTFVITGDIDAMWLRDSTAQVWPYLAWITEDDTLKSMIQGLIRRQIRCVILDPYANAFYKDKKRRSKWSNDIPAPGKGIHERKWELDSLCYVIRLSSEYYKQTNDASVFDLDWKQAMNTIVKVFKVEQRKRGSSPYHFKRKTDNHMDAPVNNGKGRPIKPTGLIVSSFRPSDDATLFSFHIPSNYMAVVSLTELALIFDEALGDKDFATKCATLAKEIEEAIRNHAIHQHEEFGQIYAYEVDGYGNKLFMDDANVPNLLSLPYLGAVEINDEIYKNTRKFILSSMNPYYVQGSVGSGLSSPHTASSSIWPMGIIMQAMTSQDDSEITRCLETLKFTHAGTGFMHESFDKADPAIFTRKWFAWANSLFGELIIKIYKERPHLLNSRLTLQ